jgi:hypothetical protein
MPLLSTVWPSAARVPASRCLNTHLSPRSPQSSLADARIPPRASLSAPAGCRSTRRASARKFRSGPGAGSRAPASSHTRSPPRCRRRRSVAPLARATRSSARRSQQRARRAGSLAGRASRTRPSTASRVAVALWSMCSTKRNLVAGWSLKERCVAYAAGAPVVVERACASRRCVSACTYPTCSAAARSSSIQIYEYVVCLRSTARTANGHSCMRQQSLKLSGLTEPQPGFSNCWV